LEREREAWNPGTGPTMQGIIDDKYLEVDPPEYEVFVDDDEEGEEDEDDYGEEEEEDYGDYGDYDEEEEDPFDVADARRQALANAPEQDKNFFRVGDKLRDKYSEVEINGFLNLLNIKPKMQWEDNTTHHYKLGVHNYEDENQELDFDFHLLSESERKEAEKIKFREWRSGTEVNFVLDGRVPIRPNYRF